jgi:hypothetical protein
MTNTEIAAVLKRHGFTAIELPGSNGGSILVSNAGARVLRLTGPFGHDFFWLNNALVDGSHQDLFTSLGWLNLGGDRTWIAPESDTFVGDLNNPWETYNVPNSIDPGQYGIREFGGAVHLASDLSLTNHRLGVTADLSMEKTVSATPHPFRYSADFSHIKSVEYVGYDQVTTLSLLSEVTPDLRFGLWHLAQVRATGEILVPVTDTSRPHVYFGPAQSAQIKTEPGLVRFGVANVTPLKIGLKALSVKGRTGYLKEEMDGQWSLIVRNFSVNPSAEYVDTPWDNPNDRGYAVQCYSDDGSLGDFGEMEYHTPGIGDGTGITSYTDRSQLWGFRGDRTIIEEIAERLLGVTI